VPRLYVATNGLSVWSSNDLGDTLVRTGTGRGMYSGSQVWALAPRGLNSGELLAGTNSGVYRLDRAGTRWTHMPSPMDDKLVTALAVSPHDANVILAGTQPAALYRSDDGGSTWRSLHVPMKPFTNIGFEGAVTAETSQVKHWTRVTQILFDPEDRAAVWAGVEIDSLWRSTDGGERWERVTEGLANDDIHGLAVTHHGERKLFATTYGGLHTSSDGGASWTLQKVDSPWVYMRSIVERPDRTGVIFMTNGDGPPGSHGRLYRSRNNGVSWEDAKLPGEVESSCYFLAVNPADPNLIFAAATLGQIYRSTDGGERWTALRRRLGEIRAIAWLPDGL
jgi:photosystem II stability/assembly factor-like uncharacterized protein